MTCRFHIFSESRRVKPRHKVGDKRLIVKSTRRPRGILTASRRCCSPSSIGEDPRCQIYLVLLRSGISCCDGSRKYFKKRRQQLENNYAQWCYTAGTPALRRLSSHLIAAHELFWWSALYRCERPKIRLKNGCWAGGFIRNESCFAKASTESRCYLRQPQRVSIAYVLNAQHEWNCYFCFLFIPF